MSKNCLLLFDFWSGQTDANIYDEIFTEDVTCERMQISPKMTGDIQPLDRYFFRQWKYFKQKICDRIAIDHIDIDITYRNSILREAPREEHPTLRRGRRQKVFFLDFIILNDRSSQSIVKSKISNHLVVPMKNGAKINF